jgi:hypothetical protein
VHACLFGTGGSTGSGYGHRAGEAARALL